MKRAVALALALAACQQPRTTARWHLANTPCGAQPSRQAGSLFLAGLTAAEQAQLRELLDELAGRLDAQVFDGDLDESAPTQALTQWLRPREAAWSAAIQLAAGRWGPLDGSFCAHVEVSAETGLAPVWPLAGEAVAEPRLQFVAGVLASSVAFDPPHGDPELAACRAHALAADSPLALLVQVGAQTATLAPAVERILRRMPKKALPGLADAFLWRLREASGPVAVAGVAARQWLAVPRAGATLAEVEKTLRGCRLPGAKP